ncbi:MAG: TonB-dependent receptor [Sphingobium sp.]|nr:TonB-dependent receptor [Sphingobium sp.]
MKGFRIGSGDRAKMLRGIALAGTAMWGFQASILYAQSPASSAAANEDGGVAPDIIVTAERRATNLQDTPLSILAVTQEMVEAKGIQDLQDLSHFTPNLSISPTRGTGNAAANFVIRGISGGGGAAGERGVALYLDGVYMPRTSGAVLRVLDVDRVEVLRGPQGTLFGRNSTGGAIRIFSKQPSDTFEGSIEGTVGNFGHVDVIGSLNLPLGEGFAVRWQGAFLDKGGYVSRGTQMLGADRDYIGRVQLRGELTPNFTATGSFLYNKSESNASPFVIQEFDLRPGIDGVIQGNYGGWLNDAFKAAGQAPIAPYNDPRFVKGPYAASDVCFLDNFNPDYSSACDQTNNDKFWQADLKLDWKIGDKVSLHSVTGLSKLDHRGMNDQEVIGFERRYDIITSKVFYQELQLNAALFNDAIDLVAGGTYFHEKSASPYNYVLNRRGTAVYNNTTYFPTSGSPPNADGGLYTRGITDVFQTSDSWGAFASATWHIIDGLNLTGGLRGAWDHKDYTQNRYEPPTTAYQAADFKVVPGTALSSASKSQPFRALDYRVTLDYHFTKDIMAYGTISKAYKAGSFSATLQSGGPTIQDSIVSTIPNEKVINYEAGLRMTFLDRRLRINPTGFIMDWTNRQAALRVNCGTPGTPVANLVPGSPECSVGFLPLLQNQGDAHIKGIELDAQFVIMRGLTLDGSLGYTTYRLSNQPAGVTHLFPDIPKHSYTLGATYSGDIGFGKLTLNGNYAFVGRQSVYPDDSADSGYILPSYGLVNARVQFRPSGLPLTITAYANNLLDKVYATYAQRFGGGFWDQGPATGLGTPPRNMLSVVRGRPREVGFSLKYEF